MLRDRKFNVYKTKIFVKIIMLAWVIFTTANYSQESSIQKTDSTIQKKILSLRDCITIALENNHSIKASKQGIDIAESQKKQAESGYWPQISGKAAYTILNQDPIFDMPAFNMSLPPISFGSTSLNLGTIQVPEEKVKMMDNQNIHADIELLYPVYTGGKVQALNREAENGIEIAKQDYKKSNLQVESEVKKYFYAALLAKNLYKIGSDALERLDVTLEITENLYKNGSGKTTKLDFLKNKIMVDQVKAVVTQLKKGVKAAKEALCFTMASSDDFELPDEEIPFTTLQLDIEKLLSQAYITNPDWAKVNAAISLFKAKIDESAGAYLPNVAVIGSINQNFNSYKYGAVNNINSSLWMIGLGLEVPIFNGFRTSNEVAENEAQLRKISEQKELLHDAIVLQIRESLNSLENSEENVNNILQAKLTASENNSLTERAYQQDMAEAKDLIEAQIIASITDAQYQKALYDHIEAEADLELIVGTVLSQYKK
jgi:outer membrane protein TolC